MAAAKSFKVKMSKEKDTKTTTRYKADAEDTPVSTIYITQAECEKMGKPASIEVEVTAK